MSVVKFLKRNLNTKINGIQDPNLSWESKGLLAYLLSYSDEEFEYDVQDLISKSEFLNYYSGIPKDLKKEIFDIVREIPLDILKKNKSKLSKMTIFEFQNHLIFLRKKYGA